MPFGQNRQSAPQDTDHPAPVALIDEFENRVAEKLLAEALADLDTVEPESRFSLLSEHHARLARFVSADRLSGRNQTDLAVFNLLWQREESRRRERSAETSSRTIGNLTLTTSIEFDLEEFLVQATGWLTLAHQRITLKENHSAGTTIRQWLDAERNNDDNYLPDSPAARQQYLSLFVDLASTNVQLSDLIPPDALDFHLDGLPEDPDTLFQFDASKATLSIDLRHMDELPLFELTCAAPYYALPGFYLSNSRPLTSGFEAYFDLKGFERGWAAYVTRSASESNQPQRNANLALCESWQISLGIVDLHLHTGEWPAEKAVDYLLANTPYPLNRIRRAVTQIQGQPGAAFAGLLWRGQFEKLHKAFPASMPAEAVHRQLFLLGRLPADELERRVQALTLNQ